VLLLYTGKYMSKLNGIESKGKTNCKVFPNDGSTASEVKGGTKSSGVTSIAMKKFGRNVARIKNQKGT